MKNIAVFASGRGTNFEAIVKAVKSGKIKARLALLLCDVPGAAVIHKAEKSGVGVALVKRQDYASRKEFEERIIRILKDNKIDFVILAGFMRVLGPKLVRAYKNRILNIHPSLLPSFKGAQGIKDAFDYGAKVTGVTVHFVDEEMDHGPVILQQEVKITQDDTLESLEERIHRLEHRAYPRAIKLFLEDRLKVVGRRVKVLSR
jgi:phosphoribosylglycinamide formyltransferase-1